MRGVLAWLLVVCGCGFQPVGSGASSDAPAGSGGQVLDAPARADGSGTAIDAAIDAASNQAAAGCPTGTGWFQVQDQASSYFESSDSTSWKSAETACEALQLSGGSAIHLAVLSTVAELTTVSAHDTSQDFWIGMFQKARQATPAAGWLWITGEAGIAGVWASGEPNDQGGLFSRTDYENDDEDFSELYANSAQLNDDSDGTSLRYLCECDGVAVPAAVRAQIP